MAKNGKRGLIVGRFQPYHLGHQQAIKNCLKDVNELVIVIGSTDQSYEKENPFTAGERIEMISLALKDEKIFNRCFIVPVADIKEFALWTKRIRSYCPHFDVVYTNNPIVKELFEKDNVSVKKMVSNLKDIDAVKIREMMLNGKDWHKYVPKIVAKYLDKLGAVGRIKAIFMEEQKE